MNLNKVLQVLRNTAEKDSNDIIANAASSLAVRLESCNTPFGMKLSDTTDLDRRIIRHAMQNHDYAPEVRANKRKEYERREVTLAKQKRI
jgi:hypothetical protein